MGRAFIDALASMVERKVASDETASLGETAEAPASATQELSQSGGRAGARKAAAGGGERGVAASGLVQAQHVQEQRLIRKLADQVDNIRRDLKVVEGVSAGRSS